jgi:hypothetical protein
MQTQCVAHQNKGIDRTISKEIMIFELSPKTVPLSPKNMFKKTQIQNVDTYDQWHHKSHLQKICPTHRYRIINILIKKI